MSPYLISPYRQLWAGQFYPAGSVAGLRDITDPFNALVAAQQQKAALAAAPAAIQQGVLPPIAPLPPAEPFPKALSAALVLAGVAAVGTVIAAFMLRGK